MTEQRPLKGDDFLNRYRIQGTLTTVSPLHIGDGSEDKNRGPKKPRKSGTESSPEKKKDDDDVGVSMVAVDHNGRAMIPGSSLKGAIRNYLTQVLYAVHCDDPDSPDRLANRRDYEKWAKEFPDQESQTCAMRCKASVLERLFGTPFAQGKAEFWDAECDCKKPVVIPDSMKDTGRPPYFNPTRTTCVHQSVAIDPVTQTALDKKLYHFEAVPPGVTFKLNISGQNLVYVELGMLLFGLHAFNSEIWPVTLGAMAGRGFGRMRFTLEKICHLGKAGLGDWVEKAMENDHAGYFSLDPLEKPDMDRFIDLFKTAFLKAAGGGK